MGKEQVPFLSFNRGLISPKGLARVDLDRTRLSAEVMTNWLPRSQGAMNIRPGTKYMGSSRSDTGAEFIEFVASTDDLALLELTHEKMRVWLGDDAHSLALLSRPAVDTTLTLTDTGWSNTSLGGAFATPSTNAIPTMTSSKANGVEITASSENTSKTGASIPNRSAWKVADASSTEWNDTGENNTTLPSWLNVDFDTGGSDTGARRAVTSYSITSSHFANEPDRAPKRWSLLTGNHDTGTFATDTGKWTLMDTQGSETGWAASETRTYTVPEGDTGTVTARRHWRLHFFESNNSAQPLCINAIRMFTVATAQQVKQEGGRRIFNATSIGALSRLEKRVLASDTGTEHSLAITVDRGPITLRVGSSQRDDDLVGETSLGTGYHNLAFTPGATFWVTLQTNALADRIVGTLAIGDTGTVELTTPWASSDLGAVRYDQSADVVYVDCSGVRPQKIERRGTGRSWSVVNYEPTTGPFLPSASSTAKLSVNHYLGNVTMDSDIPFFTPGHVGALFSLFGQGQWGVFRLGAKEAVTDVIEVTGVSDTGTPGTENERRLSVQVSGTYVGRIIIERSYDGADLGFKTANPDFGASATGDTGTFVRNIDDGDDNRKVYYRCRMSEYTSGVASISMLYDNGGVSGIARVTEYESNTRVSAEVISRFSDTGPTDSWRQGYWSEANGYPTAVALHGGRLTHAQGGSIFLSVSDDYENFDDETEGDAAPIIRTLGSGPVDNIHYLVSLLRLIIGTAGAEITMRSSSLDEPLTPTNAMATTFSTQGSANLRAAKMDTRAIMVQRSRQRVFMIGPAENTLSDYEGFELTLLVPDLLEAGVVSVAIQRQPDTRIHCVLGDGKVAIVTYEPTEEVLCWSMWEGDTGTGAAVERAAVLPGVTEDAVFYHVRRTINGVTKRYIEKWALEAECRGDTGLTWIMDCARSYTDTGRTNTLTDIAPHLVNESVVGWGSLDTGSTPHGDLSPDVNGVQTTYVVDTGGDVTLSLTEGVHHAVVGKKFRAKWKSAKLAYVAEFGTALAQRKRVPQLGVLLYQTHRDGLFYGTDTGHLNPLPAVIEGAVVDADEIHETLDLEANAIADRWGTDTRLVLEAKSPRPATVLAAVPTVVTSG